MRKTILYLFNLVVVVAISASCKKQVLPPVTGPAPEPPQQVPPPPPPKLVETLPPVLTAISDSISENILGYYEALPARYTESKETYPVIIDIHGGGQYGDGSTQLWKVLQYGIPKLLDQKKFPPSFTVNNERFSFIVIAPQLKDVVVNAEMLNLLNYVKEKYRVDTNRIYLTGSSLGGRQVANYAGFRAEPFAAMVTFGGLPQINEELAEKCRTIVDSDLPVWHFHNRPDEAWPYAEAEEYIRVLRSFNPKTPPIFTTFETGEGKSMHDCWTRGSNPEYKENGKNVYEWMLGYTKSGN
jgi:predicted peptidase